MTPERSNYKVRERAAVRIAVSSKKGHLPSGSHVVVAAVDEGLLELKPNESWDLLRSMMGRRSYEVQTSTAQGQVVGKRHFGLKGQPQGGGGGTQRTRELFDTLLFWEADVALDANGQAELDIPLNDSLTQFRIVAVAHAGDELFGTGSATVRTTQDLMVLSGIPPVVREGDRFKAEFTVRNATDRRMKVKVVGSVEGLRKKLKRTVTLDGGQADVVSWEIEVPAGRETLTFSLEARSGDASDRIKVSQNVVSATPARAIQATLLQLDETKRIPVSRPSGAPADRGGIVIDWSASLVGGVDSVREYMRRYPYSCLEQRISRLVGTRDREGFDRLMERLPSYLDADGLTRFFPGMSKGSEVLSSYVLSITHEAGWVIPEAPLSRIRQGLVGFVQGRVVRGSSLPTADLTLRKLSALEALSRFGDVMPTLLGTLRIEPDLWPTSSLLDWLNVLQRVTSVPRRTVLTEQALQILRSRIEFRGREMSFSTESLDSCWWLLASVDQNSVRSILTLLGRPGWDEDLPRLVSGAMARMRNGRWGTTPANAWGILATEKYAQAFEATPPTGRSNASLFGQSFGIDWEDPDGVRSATKAWPRRRSSVVVLDHSGAGTPWVSLTARAAVPLKKPVSNGYRISKTWKKVSGEGVWATGDLIRVTLEIDAQADRTWVVLDDPIPAGAVILGSGLGRDSEFGRTGEEASRWFRPTFEERSLQSYRAYYEYLPKGTWMVEYTIRLNQEGRFNLPPSRVEAMYSPDIFGEIPMGPVNVRRGR